MLNLRNKDRFKHENVHKILTKSHKILSKMQEHLDRLQLATHFLTLGRSRSSLPKIHSHNIRGPEYYYLNIQKYDSARRFNVYLPSGT